MPHSSAGAEEEDQHAVGCWCGVDDDGGVVSSGCGLDGDKAVIVYDALPVSQGVVRGAARLAANVLSIEGAPLQPRGGGRQG